MEDEKNEAMITHIGNLPDAVKPKRVKKTQNFKWHIAVREDTFDDFREMKDEPGSDAFLKKLLKLYKFYKERKNAKTKQ